MGALYIKDDATADRVARMAQQRGTTKTALVGQALDALDEIERASRTKAGGAEPTDFAEWIKWHRARNPLPPTTGLKSDKVFFDRMWGEVD